MTVRRLGMRGAVLLLVLAVAAPALAQRIVAVGDVHGDVDALAGILQRAGLINDHRHWCGGSAVLVQVGDLIDRGSHGRDVMDLMMALEREAPRSGGRVIALLGNHEVMNLVGDLRYMPAPAFEEYSVQRSAKLRRNAYLKYHAWAKRRAKAVGYPAEPLGQAEWNAQHPLGFVEQREQFAANGRYGRWIRQHAALAQVGDVVFVHGGIDPALDVSGVAELNGRVQAELRRFDEAFSDLEAHGVVLPFSTFEEMVASASAELKAGVSDPQLHAHLQDLLGFRHWYSFRQDGPLWFRGYSEWSEDEGASKLAAMLARTGVRHVVAGHTVQPGHRIRERFGGEVFLIDTGISRYYNGGAASALEIEKGTFTAQYADERSTPLWPPAVPPHVAAPAEARPAEPADR